MPSRKPAPAASSSDSSECCWCDPDTPDDARERADVLGGLGGRLVFSDEFNVHGRSFANGEDSRWTAINKPDDTNGAVTYMSPEDAVTLNDSAYGVDGALRLRLHKLSEPREGMPYQGSQLQGWNKFCFTGGSVEVRARVPYNKGAWPSVWLLGNIARATYLKSTDGTWPWSYDSCDDEHLQMPFGSIPQRFVGRGAPEVDLFESTEKYIAFSTQMAPRLPPDLMPEWHHNVADAPPGADHTWYRNITRANGADYNPDWWGPPWSLWDQPRLPTPFNNFGELRSTPGYADAITVGVVDWSLTYSYHTIRVDWMPTPPPSDGNDDKGGGTTAPSGYLRWYLDDKLVLEILEDSLGAYSDCEKQEQGFMPFGPRQECCYWTPTREVSTEPMYLILSNVLAYTWSGGVDGFGDGPADLWVDYVRVWQAEGLENTGCSPVDMPTTHILQALMDEDAVGEPVTPLGSETCPLERNMPLRPVRYGMQPNCTHHAQPRTLPFCPLPGDLRWDPAQGPLLLTIVLVWLAVCVLGMWAITRTKVCRLKVLPAIYSTCTNMDIGVGAATEPAARGDAAPAERAGESTDAKLLPDKP